MSWSTGRPIYGRLPVESGNWQGSPVVDWLTSFWDELLVQHKANLDNPTDWLGEPDQINEYFIDWVAIGLCGYGSFWDTRLTLDQKRRVISAYGQSRFRQSRSGLDALVDAIIPGSRIQNTRPARADFAIAGISSVADPQSNSYQILVPIESERRSREWRLLDRILKTWAPIGYSRVQHSILMADLSICGDVVTQTDFYGYS